MNDIEHWDEQSDTLHHVSSLAETVTRIVLTDLPWFSMENRSRLIPVCIDMDEKTTTPFKCAIVYYMHRYALYTHDSNDVNSMSPLSRAKTALPPYSEGLMSAGRDQAG